jgi:hypothetical protein
MWACAGSPKERWLSTRRKPARSARLHISSREKKANWPSSASMNRKAAALRKWRISSAKVPRSMPGGSGRFGSVSMRRSRRW